MILQISRCICFIYLILLTTAELDFHSSCLNNGPDKAIFGDASPRLTSAFNVAKIMAGHAYTRLNLLMTDKSKLSNTEIVRIYKLLTAWFIPPFIGDSNEPPWSRKPNRPGYQITVENLRRVIKTLADADESKMPRIFCGLTYAPEDDPSIPPWRLSGSVQKFTLNFNNNPATPILDNGRPGFEYYNYLIFGVVERMGVGFRMCPPRRYAVTASSRRWKVWCPGVWQSIRSTTLPTTWGDRAGFFHTFPFPANQADHWACSVEAAMLHEMHHVYVTPTMDAQLRFPGGIVHTAYQFWGISELANRVVANMEYHLLWSNADSVMYFILALYLVCCDWSTGVAQWAGIDAAVPGDEAVY